MHEKVKADYMSTHNNIMEENVWSKLLILLLHYEENNCVYGSTLNILTYHVEPALTICPASYAMTVVNEWPDN